MSYIPQPVSVVKSTVTITSASASKAVPGWNYVAFVDASGGDVAVTLPSPSNKAGQQIEIIRTDDTPANKVTIASTSGKLNGVAANTAAISLLLQNQGIEIDNNGTDAWGTQDEFSGEGLNVVTKTAAAASPVSYTALSQDDIILCDASLDNVTIILPKISDVSQSANNKTFTIKALNIGATYAVTVTPDAADTIEVPNSSGSSFSGSGQVIPVAGGALRYTADITTNRWVLT